MDQTSTTDCQASARTCNRKLPTVNEDDPPMSRLFIICNKAHSESDIWDAFSPFGKIEELTLVKDKHTQQNRGLSYVKFSKTSEAAKALEEMNGKAITGSDRALKVLVASNRNRNYGYRNYEEEKRVRLYIISREETEEEIKREFSKYGDVENVTTVKDKETGNPKGFGYVRYKTFYHAAVAYESCPSKYKAVFAEPKWNTTQQSQHNLLGRSNEDMLTASCYSRSNGRVFSDTRMCAGESRKDISSFTSLQNVSAPQPSYLQVVTSTSVTQDQLWKLFDIVPGLDFCYVSREVNLRTKEFTVVYNNPRSAQYAKEKLHGIEYPLGERIVVFVVNGSSTSRVDVSFADRRSSDEPICSVALPPQQPLAVENSPVARRLFVSMSASLPQSVLHSVFSRFVGLIDICLFNENCGYVRYAVAEGAQKAMQALDGAEICGAKVKIVDAEHRNCFRPCQRV